MRAHLTLARWLKFLPLESLPEFLKVLFFFRSNDDVSSGRGRGVGFWGWRCHRLAARWPSNRFLCQVYQVYPCIEPNPKVNPPPAYGMKQDPAMPPFTRRRTWDERGSLACSHLPPFFFWCRCPPGPPDRVLLRCFSFSVFCIYICLSGIASTFCFCFLFSFFHFSIFLVLQACLEVFYFCHPPPTDAWTRPRSTTAGNTFIRR